MQAVQVSRHFREHFDRAITRGSQAYRDAQAAQGNRALLLDSLQAYGEAFGLANAAISVASARDYGRWNDARSQAKHAARHVRLLLEEAAS